MNKYRINISYYTGNSFGSEDVEETLDPIWENLDIAKENLIRIKEHYQMYFDMNHTWGRNNKPDDILNKHRDKPWFVDEQGSMPQYYAEHTLNLKLDNGNDYRISAFWCGYFEGLYEAEIIADETDMKISFR
jgi:hypothetical protein